MAHEKGQHLGYVPEPLESDDPHEITLWCANEFARIAAVIRAGLAREIEFLHVEPTKVFEGMIVGADGTDWNPGGGGQGVYAYYNSTWNRLG